MKMKSKLIAMISGLTLACIGATGSYAYFTVEKSAGENIIAMGKFPKAKVQIFASTGPLYSDAFGNGSNSATGNYITWLDGASQYIAQSMLGVNLGVVGNDKGKFQNLSKGSTVDVKSNIGTFGNGNTSWQASKQNTGNENGNMVHYVVAIFNEANKGEEAGRKLNYKNEHVKIERYDNFKGESGKAYKIRKEENVSLNGNEERIRTFDFDGTKLIQDGSHGNPSEDADLIIFDVGSLGYFTTGTEQKDLDKLNNSLIGQENILDEKNNIIWQSNNPLYKLASKMQGTDKKARLLNSVCNVSFKYTKDSSYEVSDSYTINMTGTRIEIVEEKPNEKPSQDKRPIIPENNTKPEGPNNGNDTTNTRPGLPRKPGTIIPGIPTKPENTIRPGIPGKPGTIMPGAPTGTENTTRPEVSVRPGNTTMPEKNSDNNKNNETVK